MRCDEVEKDADGTVIGLKGTIDCQTLGAQPEGRKVKGVIHWVSARHAVAAEVRLYDRLYSVPNPGAEGDPLADLNPDSLQTTGALLEPSLAAAQEGERFQFERLGYFVVDPDSSPQKPVFNRTVTLKDSWGKKS